MKRLLLFATASFIGISATTAEIPQSEPFSDSSTGNSQTVSASGSETAMEKELTDLVSLVLTDMPASDEKVKYDTLTEEDFKIVAQELGVEVAAIKAVVKIEAGTKLQGFWAPGVPVINYAKSLFDKYNRQVKGRKMKDAKVPSGLSGYALKEWTSLTNARKINADAADMGTYWGMFQIGGFNYKLCGCQSVEEMVAKICESEFSQLEIFAVFIRNSGMLESLQKKDWATFARKYNGPSYAKRGYHTRMAKEYANYKSNASSGTSAQKSADTKNTVSKSGTDKKPTEMASQTTDTIKKKAPTRKKTRRKRKRTKR
ncbi:MAG: N-acetylmuramidase family protein [Muribaculaceae bacterium]|nr:N-acetylmuramidase family protein [Muribaculaceae bacterium]